MLNKQPSKEYTKNINYYKKMHLEGYTLNEIKIICICSIKENDMIKYFPLQYDDKLTNYEIK